MSKPKYFLLPTDLDAIACYRLIFPAEAMHDAEVAEFMLPLSTYNHDGILVLEWDASLREVLKDGDTYVFAQHLRKNMPILCRTVLARGKALVLDCDDYYEGAPTWNVATKAIWNNPDMNVKQLKEQRQLADTLTVSTPFLAEAYARDNKNIHVLRNALDWRMWDELTPAYEVERHRVRVGWIGAAAWRSGDLAELEKWFPDWIARHPEVDFVASGTNSEVVHDGLRIPHAQRITLPYMDFKSRRHPLIVNQMDIGLVPLKMIEFNEAKSHLKGLEYNACGIPFIASPTESYRWWTKEGENGFLARNPKQWAEALDQLVGDAELRNQMGRTGRALAETQTVQKRWGEWAKAWGSVTRKPTVEQVAQSSVTFGALQKWDEFASLLKIAAGAKILVEIGSAGGGAMYGFSKVADPEALLISIDLPGGPLGGQYSAGMEFRKPALALDTQTLHMIRGDSHSEKVRDELVGLLDGRMADLLFIDGDHTYQGVKQDYEDYAPLAKTVALHDISDHSEMPELECHVDEFWRELLEDEDLDWATFIRGDGLVSGIGGGIGVIFRVPQLVLA